MKQRPARRHDEREPRSGRDSDDNVESPSPNVKFLLALTEKWPVELPAVLGSAQNDPILSMLSDIDIPELASYHSTMKSGWKSSSLNCETFLVHATFQQQLFLKQSAEVTGGSLFRSK